MTRHDQTQLKKAEQDQKQPGTDTWDKTRQDRANRFRQAGPERQDSVRKDQTSPDRTMKAIFHEIVFSFLRYGKTY